MVGWTLLWAEDAFVPPVVILLAAPVLAATLLILGSGPPDPVRVLDEIEWVWLLSPDCAAVMRCVSEPPNPPNTSPFIPPIVRSRQ